MGPSSPQTASCDANRFLQITIDHILQKAPIMSRPFNINAPQLDPFLLNRPAGRADPLRRRRGYFVA